MLAKKLHHAAYRCRDAQQTVDFYTKYLDLKYAYAVKSVEYRGKYCPHIHVFFQMQDGSFVAFFELPAEQEMGWDPNTPRWVQHLALEVENQDVLAEVKARLEADGIEVYGIKQGHTCASIYFFDPSGHRMELSSPYELDAELGASDAVRLLKEWNVEKSKYPVGSDRPAA